MKPLTMTCPNCDGSGVEVFGITVYEHGCGYSHDSTDERPCPTCHGSGRLDSFATRKFTVAQSEDDIVF